jgi:pimeloyl-ACP methyl ester carboxylesterase
VSTGRRLAALAGVSIAGYEVLGWYRRHARRWLAPSLAAVRAPLTARAIGGGNTVVLVHGLGASHRYWSAVYDVIAERHRLVVPDLLGFGASPPPASGYTPDGHAGALAACIESAGGGGPAVVVAHSLGTVVALRLAAVRPGLVSALLAFGPTLYPDPATARRHVDALGPMARLFARETRFAQEVCEWVCAHRDVAGRIAVLARPDLPPAIAHDGVEHTWASYSQTLRHGLLAATASSWLDAIAVPVQLVAGEHDRVCDGAWLERLATRHPNVTFERWPGGHDLPLDVPERIVECVARVAASRIPHNSARRSTP